MARLLKIQRSDARTEIHFLNGDLHAIPMKYKLVYLLLEATDKPEVERSMQPCAFVSCCFLFLLMRYASKSLPPTYWGGAGGCT